MCCLGLHTNMQEEKQTPTLHHRLDKHTVNLCIANLPLNRNSQEQRHCHLVLLVHNNNRLQQLQDFHSIVQHWEDFRSDTSTVPQGNTFQCLNTETELCLDL